MKKITGRFIGILMVGLLLAILSLRPETAYADRDCTLFDSDLASSRGYVLQSAAGGVLRDAIECANRNGTDDIIDLNGFTFSYTSGGFHRYSGYTALEPIKNSGSLRIRNGTIERDLSLTSCSTDKDDTNFRLLNVDIPATLHLDNVTLRNGCALDRSGGKEWANLVTGGAIVNYGKLYVNGSHFEGNEAQIGAAIANYDRVVIANSSFVGNSASRVLTGFTVDENVSVVGHVIDNADTTIINSTFSDNTLENSGATVFFSDDDVNAELINVTIANNNGQGIAIQDRFTDGNFDFYNVILANNTGQNCSHYVRSETDRQNISATNSYSDDDKCDFAGNGGTDEATIRLSPLAQAPNGTYFHPLLGGDPLDGGSTGFLPTEDDLDIDVDQDGSVEGNIINVDQGGSTRVAGATIDAGAFERSCDHYNAFLTQTGYSVGLLNNDFEADLQDALACANDNDSDSVIDFGGRTITLTSAPAAYDGHGFNGLPEISKRGLLTIKNGTLARDTALDCTVGSGDSDAFRLLNIAASSTVYLEDMVLENGCSDDGGAIYNEGDLRLNGVHFQDNSATAGAAIYNDGQLTGVNSSFSHNSGQRGSGASIVAQVGDATTLVNTTFNNNNSTGDIIYAAATGQLVLVNSTLATNTATQILGFVASATAVHKVENSVFAENTAVNCHFDSPNSLLSAKGSYSDDDSCNFGSHQGVDNESTLLGGAIVMSNGTRYKSLEGGRAVEGGSSDVLPTEAALGIDVDRDGQIEDSVVSIDQRGEHRKAGNHVDAGAHEISCDPYRNGYDNGAYVLGTEAAGLDADLRLALECGQHSNTPVKIEIDMAGQTVALDYAPADFDHDRNGHIALTHIRGEHRVTIKNGTIERDATLACDGGVNDRSEFRFFFVHNDATLHLENMTLRNGCANDSVSGSEYDTLGGAIFSDGTLKLNAVHFEGNQATGGGAVYMDGSLTAVNSSFTHNRTLNDGAASGTAALSAGGDGATVLVNTTFSDNVSGTRIVYLGGTSVHVVNTTIAENSSDRGAISFDTDVDIKLYNVLVANNGGRNCEIGLGSATAATSGSYSDDDSCQLGDGGGTDNAPATFDAAQTAVNGTVYRPLLHGLAVNGGHNDLIPGEIELGIDVDQNGKIVDPINHDQAGNVRIDGGTVDAGAFESACVAKTNCEPDEEVGEESCSDLGYVFPYTVGTVDGSDHVADLKAAIACANESETAVTITLSSNIVLTTIDNETSGNNGLPVISSELTLDGAGLTIERDAAYQSCGGSDPDFRFLTVADNGRLFLNNITLKNGCISGNETAARGGAIQNLGVLNVSNSLFSHNATSERAGAIFNNGEMTLTATIFGGNSSNSLGGALLNGSDGKVTIDSSSFSNNTANKGGALFNNNVMVVQNSTISGNSSGLYSAASGSLEINFSTITNNGEEGLFDNGGTVVLNATILADNGGDCVHNGSVSGSHNLIQDGGSACGLGDGNLIGVNAELDALVGRPTLGSGRAMPTQAIAASSPALDFIAPDDCSLAVDQRGQERPLGNGCDIGAYEAQTSLVVSNLADNNDGNFVADELTLREAMTIAVPGTTITFAESLSGGTIVLNETLTIAKDLTISGNVPITISGNDAVRVLEVTTGTVTLENLALVNGRADGEGAGLWVHTSVTVHLINSTLAHHRAVHGTVVGIHNEGNLTIQGSTLSDNVSEDRNVAGGIWNSGTVAIENSTISGNSGQHIGAILNSGQMTLLHVTVADNSYGSGNSQIGGIGNGGDLTLTNSLVANNMGVDCTSSGDEAVVTDGGHNLVEVDHVDNGCGLVNDVNGNLVGVDPLLDGLADNGGQTLTHGLLASSPAADGVAGSACLELDQRGVARSLRTRCDIGAVEMTSLGGTAIGGNLGLVAATGGALLVGLAGLLVWRRREG